MFLDYYGLREQPFGVTPDPRFLYFSPSHREALASLYYGIETGRGFLALIAEPGMGKTTLLFHLLEKLRGSARTAFIFRTQCDSREFLRSLMADLGYSSRDDDLILLQEHLNEILVREARSGSRVVLVVDEAQNLADPVLETVRMLSNFETSRVKLIQILLAGQPQLAAKLASPNLVQLRQRVSILSRLNHLGPREAVAFVNHRLRVAGHNGKPLFTPEALAIIASGSEGIPRNINNICFHTLTLGFARDQRTIGAPLIEEVLADLEVAPSLSGSTNDSESAFDPLSRPRCPSLEEILVALDTSDIAGSNNAGGSPSSDSSASQVVMNQPPALNPLTADWATKSIAAVPEAPEAAMPSSGSRRTKRPMRRTSRVPLVVCLVLLAGLFCAFRVRDWKRLVAHPETTFHAAMTNTPLLRSDPRTARTAVGATSSVVATSKTDADSSSTPNGIAGSEAETDPHTVSSSATLATTEIEPSATGRPAPSQAQGASITMKGLRRSRQKAELTDKLAVATYYYDRGEYDLALNLFAAALRIDPSSNQAKTGVLRTRQALSLGTTARAQSSRDLSTHSVIDR